MAWFASPRCVRFDVVMSPRVIQLPMSGRDRRHYVQQLRAAEQEHARVCADLTEAITVFQAHRIKAHALACREWNIRQFIGGPAAASPRILDAIDAGFPLLEVHCKRCGRPKIVELADLVWPRESQIHTLARPLRCLPCLKEGARPQTNLVALHRRPEPSPEAPAAARRRS
jgi:hypothetical protein